jgi:hypothetical protein
MSSDLSVAPTIVDAKFDAELDALPLQSGVSWEAVAAGAISIAALTLLLVALGAGLGLSAVSPWSNSGVSASTFSIGTGIYLVIVGIMSSAIGGYLAGRLRTKWVGIHTNEAFFRDTAHGFLAWAFATLISATALVSTTAYLANGALANGALTNASGVAAQNAQALNPAQLYVDKLFRAAPVAGTASAGDSAIDNSGPRAEVVRLWTADFATAGDLPAADRAYVAQIVTARSGLSQAEAERRVDQVVNEAKEDADRTRRAAAHLSFWLTAALLAGAFAASLAAAEGGALRDGTWDGRVLRPRAA